MHVLFKAYLTDFADDVYRKILRGSHGFDSKKQSSRQIYLYYPKWWKDVEKNSADDLQIFLNYDLKIKVISNQVKIKII